MPLTTEKQLDTAIEAREAVLPILVNSLTEAFKGEALLPLSEADRIAQLSICCRYVPWFKTLCDEIYNLNLQDQIDKGMY